ncbi:DUF4199 domain-containing protein [Flavobacterium enshiense]|uniref:DUF4199 domain-containing protein n=1 Tax=Flavobacterium enshiense TaxID=1341165 RepID=UPI00345D4709
MEKNITPAKHALSYGVTFGIILVLEFVLMYVLNIDPSENAWAGVVMNLLNYLVLPFALTYIAANKFKKEINDGFLSISETLKAGVSITVLAALIYGVFYILFDFIFPEFKEELFEKIQQVTIKQNPAMTAEQLKMSMKFVKIFMNPYIAAPFTVVMYAVIGLIHSLIVGVILKKDKPIFE